MSGLIDSLLKTKATKYIASSTDNTFVRLQGSSIEVPKYYFDNVWTDHDWMLLATKLLQLLPPGSAHAITMARKKQGPNFLTLYKEIGMYATCPAVVQEAMFLKGATSRRFLSWHCMVSIHFLRLLNLMILSRILYQMYGPSP